MKRTIVIISLIAIILLVSSYIASSTYALLNSIENKTNINTSSIVAPDDMSNEIIYNYLIERLNLTDEEAKLVINSVNLNNTFKEVFNNINSNNITSDEIAASLTDAIDHEHMINNELKEKINNEINNHKLDIIDYFKQKKKN